LASGPYNGNGGESREIVRYLHGDRFSLTLALSQRERGFQKERGFQREGNELPMYSYALGYVHATPPALEKDSMYR
jgi:hypothetical protein